MPEEIRLLTNLRSLILGVNSLAQIALINISRLPQLQELDLSYNGLDQLPEEIRLLTNLRRLKLQGNRFSEQAQAAIRGLLPGVQITF